MSSELSTIKNSVIGILIAICISLISTLYILQSNGIEQLRQTLDKLDASVSQLEKATSLLGISLQVADDRTKENEREIRELIKKSYEKK